VILYIAGPMTGLPEYNFPAFHAAADQLTAAGYEVLNPARRAVDPGRTWADYLRDGIRDVTDADGLALLDGWMASRGARLELTVATGLDMPVGIVAVWLDRARQEAP
jgi:hypothetical protein